MKAEKSDRHANAPSEPGMPRVFAICDLVPRANSRDSRSARVVNEHTTSAKNLLAGVFWSHPGAGGGWSFGDTDTGVAGCPHVRPRRGSLSLHVWSRRSRVGGRLV